uniref:MO25-like protein At5g47540 isoform X2 n=1 Tax=Hirondellea gigas TaxID=1518452 RepID=A0A6A7G0M5_9CRUS
MAFLFKKKPAELCKNLLKHLTSPQEETDTGEEKGKKDEKIAGIVVQIRVMLYGDEETEPKIVNIQKLRDELTNENNLLIILIQGIPTFDLKTQKEVVKIVTFFLRRGRQNAFVEYFSAHLKIIGILMKGYEDKRVAMHHGPIIRECIAHKELCTIFLDITHVSKFFELVRQPSADLASDVFITLRKLLFDHKSAAGRFLDANYETIFDDYFVTLLSSENFVTRKKALTLLHDLLLEKKNQKQLFRYVSDTKHLKSIMNMLRIKKIVLQFAVFDVFKLFLANTRKSPSIVKILHTNRDILKGFLEKLEIEGNPEFVADKQFLLRQLDELELLKPQDDDETKIPHPSPSTNSPATDADDVSDTVRSEKPNDTPQSKKNIKPEASRETSSGNGT